MAYDCRVYRILIASPSDVDNEREIAVRVIQKWNDMHSYSRKVVLLPLRWETHTAPDYATRAQEIVNRAIVDDCDLLAGIFWSRVGSPTGVAESGTLEEIERAKKPVMLYFSRQGIDPDTMDLDQFEKLKQFKEKIKGLVEAYKSIIEFEDKFSRQLELKIRELQQHDASGKLPLSLKFVSVENGQPIGSSLTHEFDHPIVSDFDVAPVNERETLKSLATTAIKVMSYFPVVLAIENSSPSGIRNLFVELVVTASSDKVEVSESARELCGVEDFAHRFIISHRLEKSLFGFRNEDSSAFRLDDKVSECVRRGLDDRDKNYLQSIEGGWRISFDWDALQPQRTRWIRRELYVYSPESADLSLRARVFADSFPEPLALEATVRINAHQRVTDVTGVLPDWKDRLREAVSKKE